MPTFNTKSKTWRMLIACAIFICTLARWAPEYNKAFDKFRIAGSGYESLKIAQSLAQGRGFSNPYLILETGPTAHLAPVLPFVLSFPIRWFGDGAFAAYVISWMAIFAAAFQISLWPFVSRRLEMGFASGVIAAGVWLFINLPPIPFWEADYAAILILLLSIGMKRLLNGACSTKLLIFVAGLWALTILTSPVVVLPFIALAFWMILRTNVTTKQKFGFVVIPLLLLPWTIRNYRTFHHLFLVRDNLGLELSVGNNRCAQFSFRDNFYVCYLHPDDDELEAQRLVALSEYNYNQQKLHQALQWMSDNQGRFRTLTLQRFVAFWLPNGSGNPFTSNAHYTVQIYWVVTLLSIPGLVLLWRRDRTSAGICLVWLGLFPPVYYLIQFDLRYRTPIVWATLIPASFALTRIAHEILTHLRPVTVVVPESPLACRRSKKQINKSRLGSRA
jgi:hypothetical protein